VYVRSAKGKREPGSFSKEKTNMWRGGDRRGDLTWRWGEPSKKMRGKKSQEDFLTREFEKLWNVVTGGKKSTNRRATKGLPKTHVVLRGVGWGTRRGAADPFVEGAPAWLSGCARRTSKKEEKEERNAQSQI